MIGLCLLVSSLKLRLFDTDSHRSVIPFVKNNLFSGPARISYTQPKQEIQWRFSSLSARTISLMYTLCA